MTTDGELWHIVEAKRDDGTPTMFRIREIEPRRQLTRIFVVELPYPKTELSRLPNASDYRRLAEFDEQWLRPACSSLGWEYVGSKTEDGSFFFYTYGAADPNAMIEKLSPFDVELGFYDDEDPEWQEYGTLKELLDQAKAIPALEPTPATNGTALPTPTPVAKPKAAANTKAKTKAKPAAKAKRTARPKAKAKTAPIKKAAAKKTATKAKPKRSAKPKATKRKRR
jgi:hypothetical protein